MGSVITDLQMLTEKLTPIGQEHLLQYWDQLTDQQRKELTNQIESIDFHEIQNLHAGESTETDWDALATKASSPNAVRENDPSNAFSEEAAIAQGIKSLQAGEIGLVLVAGGQASRLGLDYPKGMYPIGPVSQASLYQILFEKISALSRIADREVPLFIMTSPATDQPTKDYLTENNHFSLNPNVVTQFCQGTMPAVDQATGKLLMSEKDSIATSPDGHGGILFAMNEHGILQRMQQRGIKYLYYFQVDNPLVYIGDPALIGHHILNRSQVTTKVVSKSGPEERVGNVVDVEGQTLIIEYSDLPPKHAVLTDDSGGLKFWAGNIAIHVFDVDFLHSVVKNPGSMSFHRASKQVAHLNEHGEVHQPENPNAYKFERFIFDILPAAERSLVVETDRANEFAAVKNATGKDSPETTHAGMNALAQCWLERHGVTVSDSAIIEVSPHFAVNDQEFAEAFAEIKELVPKHIEQSLYFAERNVAPRAGT